MNTSGTDPWEIGPMVAAGTAVAIDTAQEPEPERRPPAEPGRRSVGDRPAAIGLESGGE